MERRLPPKRSSSQEVDAPRVKSWEVELRKPVRGQAPAGAGIRGGQQGGLGDAEPFPGFPDAEQGYLHIRIVVEGGGDQAVELGVPEDVPPGAQVLVRAAGGLLSAQAAGRSLAGGRKSGPTMQELRQHAARRGRCLNMDDMGKEEVRCYSCRRASMGSILDAFQDGYHPKARPMNTETPTARAMASGEEAVAQFMVRLTMMEMALPSAMPSAPPTHAEQNRFQQELAA